MSMNMKQPNGYHWQPEFIRDVCARFDAGESMGFIARVLGITRNSVLAILRKRGHKRGARPLVKGLPRLRHRKWSPEQVRAILTRHTDGDSFSDVAAAYKVSRNVIAGIVWRNG